MSHRGFEHVNVEKAPLYRAIMGVFAEAKRHFQVHLRPEDVRDALSGRDADTPTAEALNAALEQLVVWGNLAAEPDVSRVTSVEDFYRARYLYQLTREGEAVEAALATYEQTLARQATLQSVALEDIRTRLTALEALLEESEPDAARGHLLLRDLVGVFDGLAENARAFMAGLNRSLAVRRADRDAFLAYKERLIDYLQRFIGDLTTASADIATRLQRMHGSSGVVGLLERVAEREVADHLTEDNADATSVRMRLHDEWEAQWQGLLGWFLGSRSQPAQAELLRARARHAVPEVLDTARRLNEQRLGRSDRSNDFRVLARWFAECGDDAEAHRLWRGAFGLAAARHLAIDPGTLADRATAPVSPATPWPEAPAIAVSARLRATGHYRRRGQPPKVVRRDDERELLSRRLQAEAAQTRAARERIVGTGATRLSELGPLERPAFDLFLELLSEALAVEPNDHGVCATTRDGSLEIELVPVGDATIAAIETPDGVFRGADHYLRITDLTPAAAGNAR